VLFGFKPRLQASNLGLAGPARIALIEQPLMAVPMKAVGGWRFRSERFDRTINASERHSPIVTEYSCIPADGTSLHKSSKHTGYRTRIAVMRGGFSRTVDQEYCREAEKLSRPCDRTTLEPEKYSRGRAWWDWRLLEENREAIGFVQK
jgi:hypothetical protein